MVSHQLWSLLHEVKDELDHGLRWKVHLPKPLAECLPWKDPQQEPQNHIFFNIEIDKIVLGFF